MSSSGDGAGLRGGEEGFSGEGVEEVDCCCCAYACGCWLVSSDGQLDIGEGGKTGYALISTSREVEGKE